MSGAGGSSGTAGVASASSAGASPGTAAGASPGTEAGATVADAAARACLDALRLPRDADTLDALFRARCAVAPERTFLIARDRQRSWRDVDLDVSRWAARLIAAGCRPGDRVAAALPNGDATVVLLLACARARLVFCPINAALTPAELRVAVGIVRPSVLFVVDAAAVTAAEALHGAGVDAPCVEVPAATVSLDAVSGPPAAGGESPAPSRPRPDDPIAIVFTSGTTGTPKGAVHVQRTYVIAAEIAAWRMRLNPSDTMLLMLPLFHLNALFYSVGGAITTGARLVIEERFSAASFWDTVNRHGVTQANMIAAVGNILLKRDRAEFPGNPTLRKISTAPVSAEVAAQLREAFGITNVVESYGMTEAPGIAQVDFDDTSHRACLGRPIRHPLTGAPVSELRVVDDARQALPPGVPGRIMVRSTTMMKGYYNRPDLADAVDRDGWFLTQDVGVLDADGYGWFKGRTAEMIRTRGENVAASEVEAVLLLHPAVSDAACVGVPSELGEEDLVAVLALRPGASVEPEALAAFCAERLAPHKRPRWVVVRADLPKTPTEKVARHVLRADPGLMKEARPC